MRTGGAFGNKVEDILWSWRRRGCECLRRSRGRVSSTSGSSNCMCFPFCSASLCLQERQDGIKRLIRMNTHLSLVSIAIDVIAGMGPRDVMDSGETLDSLYMCTAAEGCRHTETMGRRSKLGSAHCAPAVQMGNFCIMGTTQL